MMIERAIANLGRGRILGSLVTLLRQHMKYGQHGSALCAARLPRSASTVITVDGPNGVALPTLIGLPFGAVKWIRADSHNFEFFVPRFLLTLWVLYHETACY